jgi:hypothetical protein
LLKLHARSVLPNESYMMITDTPKTRVYVKTFTAILLVPFLWLLSGTTASAQQGVIQTDDFIIAPAPEIGHVCELPATDIDRNFFKRAQERDRSVMRSQGERRATFEIDYFNQCEDGSNWPEEAKTAFEYALDIWGNYLQSTIPIAVEAIWTERDENVLGSAGPTRIVQLTSGAEPNTWYSIAQGSAMAGQDIKEQIADEDYDVVVNMNCEFPDWYFGTDANTPQGMIDFVTVVLHEIGHGIGFIGSMSADEDNQTGSYGLGQSNDPIIYDRFAKDGQGDELLDTSVYGNPSNALYQALTGQRSGILFDGQDSRSVYMGQAVPLYAPSEWNQGSSFSHVDQNTFSQQQNLENALMRPRIDRQFAIHSPGPVFCGMLSDWGWPLGESCLELVGAEAYIALDETALDFGVTNVNQHVSRSFTITNEEQAEDPLVYNISIESGDYIVTPAGDASGSIEPGDTKTITIRYNPRNDRIHRAEARLSHNAMNAASPLIISLEGEALRENEIARLEHNYPNPFNPSTTIPFVLSEDNEVRLDIYNVNGQLVQTLVNEFRTSNRYEEPFDASGLSSGMYFYRLIVGDMVQTKRLLFIK